MTKKCQQMCAAMQRYINAYTHQIELIILLYCMFPHLSLPCFWHGQNLITSKMNRTKGKNEE